MKINNKKLPYLILYNAVSVDGRIDHFPVDMGLFYSLISIWKEDATLSGCDTLLNAYPPELVAKEGKDIFAPRKKTGMINGHYWLFRIVKVGFGTGICF